MDTPDARESIISIRELPTLPTVLGQILTTVSDPEASALDLGRHIAADQSLSATLLRLVNSAYYGFYRQINSVTMAIVILGFLEVRNLVMAATTFRVLANPDSSYDRVQLWRHALAVAMGSERCAKQLGWSLDEAFICGLLHDIGKVALDTLYPDQFTKAAERAHENGKFIRETELETFGMDHAEVGGLLAEHWNLPASVMEAIRFHHNPAESSGEDDLASLTAVANYIAYQADLGESSNGRGPVFPEYAMDQLALPKKILDDVCKDVRQNRERIDEILGSLVVE